MREPKTNVVFFVSDHARHCSHQARRVLIIGVQHHHHVRAPAQSFAVAGLLIAPVTEVSFVHVRRQTQLTRQLHGAVTAVVVNHQHLINNVTRQLGASARQGPRGVVRGHYHKDAHAVQHGFFSSLPGRLSGTSPIPADTDGLIASGLLCLTSVAMIVIAIISAVVPTIVRAIVGVIALAPRIPLIEDCTKEFPPGALQNFVRAQQAAPCHHTALDHQHRAIDHTRKEAWHR